MASRITESDLERIVERLNVETGNNPEPFTRANGVTTPNPGSYLLAGAYGGWKLEQIVRGGGTRDVLGTGYIPKRALYEQIRCYMGGVQDTACRLESK